MFAAHIIINVKPESVHNFQKAVVEEAKASVRDEPDCFRFDIFKDRSKSNCFHFLEVFTDAEALEKHYETPHFVRMWQTIEGMIEGELRQTDLDLVYSSDTSLAS